MTASVQDDTIVLSCTGVEFIRARATLCSLIGGKCRVERGRIFLPLNCADLVLDHFPEIRCPELESRRGALDLHFAAVVKANSDFAQARIDRVAAPWCDTLDIPQQYAVNAMICPNLRGACLFDEQGTGKTVMTIAAFDLLVSYGEVSRMIVVAPKSMLGGWEKDFIRFTQDKYRIGIVEGSTEEKRTVVDSCPDVLIVNYEGMSNVLVLLKAIAKQSKVMLSIDESYYAKNPNAVRSSLLQELRPFCVKGYVLCGTPAPRTPYDLINQVTLADDGFAFAGFTKGASEDADRDRIKNIVQTRAVVIRRLKKAVLKDVPEKNFEIVRVALTGRQREMYDKARDQLLVELKSLDNRTFKKRLTSYFQKRASLLEICATPRMVDPLFTAPSAKLVKLIQLVESLVVQKRKVLIWTCFRSSVDEIKEALAHYSPLVIDGSVTSSSERSLAVERFQTDSSFMVMIANPAAAGAGITLHASHDAIYYSYTNQAAHYLQSLDRIHRRGQLAPTVNYYMLISENTIEENEVKRLRQREIAQHDLLGDVIPWPESLDQALAELTAPGV
ncbi:DEAD/DEAH box helicase [Fibrobacter succinogenes]|uniref:DEAD/DEAH box helicase n=1 Tax=Fibrobacter succinogenes TaxID=833 RepID=UPI001568F7BD|nr:DEAD/DEAH box helicase [Fibrobacter succinogenes]